MFLIDVHIAVLIAVRMAALVADHIAVLIADHIAALVADHIAVLIADHIAALVADHIAALIAVLISKSRVVDWVKKQQKARSPSLTMFPLTNLPRELFHRVVGYIEPYDISILLRVKELICVVLNNNKDIIKCASTTWTSCDLLKRLLMTSDPVYVPRNRNLIELKERLSHSAAIEKHVMKLFKRLGELVKAALVMLSSTAAAPTSTRAPSARCGTMCLEAFGDFQLRLNDVDLTRGPSVLFFYPTASSSHRACRRLLHTLYFADSVGSTIETSREPFLRLLAALPPSSTDHHKEWPR
ncbi:hypothetical protein GGR50DRAFT_701070 [Xylaria sp. CBS 124048]|nr:hypothetical protein GGR50DRAFT_701070 [Xylaria sp. CBS 124048]